MYSIYLETVKCRNEAKEQPEGKHAENPTKNTLKKSDGPHCEPGRHPILRRITTPFPGPGSIHSLTKRDSSRTAETELLSDDDEDILGAECDFDWKSFISDIYSDDDDSGSFGYSVDEGSPEEYLQGQPWNSTESSRDSCPVKPSRTTTKEEESVFSLTDSEDDDDEESLSLHSFSFRDQEDPSLPMIQVLPGLHLPFRGSEETIKAIEKHCIATTHCTCCEEVLYCSQEVTHVLCSECQVVSLVYSVERHRPAVGVGWTEEEFSSHLDQWSSSQSSLSMPPLI